jgi:hypothetical protein
MRAIETGHHRGHQAAILCMTEYFCTVFRRESILTGLVVASLKAEDYFPLQKRWWLRLKEKGGKVNEMGCHHKLEQ